MFWTQAKKRRVRNLVFRETLRVSIPGFLLIIVFSSFINILKFATPLYLLQVLDRIPASRSAESLVMLTIIVVVAITASVALIAVRKRMLFHWGQWLERRWGPKLLEQKLSSRNIGSLSSARSSLDELAKIRTFVHRGLPSWLDIFWAPAFILGVYMVNAILGTIALLSAILLVVLTLAKARLTRDPRHLSRSAANDATRMVVSAERNIETVGALSMAGNIVDRWRHTTAMLQEERNRADRHSTLFESLVKGLGHCTRISVIGVGIWLYLENSLTLGGLFAARIMTGFGYRIVERALSNWRSLSDARTAYACLREELSADRENAVSVLEDILHGALEVDVITFKHPGQRQSVIRRLSFVLSPGEILVITGRAASGKTTLCRLLVGVLVPQYGQIRLGENSLQRLPADMKSQLIGYLPQQVELFKGSVRENIARMGPESDLGEIVAAARLVGIHDTIVRLPQGYDTELSEFFIGMSGSERKRIALARAFYGRPRLIVLDEPAANLDRTARRVLDRAVQQLAAGGSSVVMTQASGSARRVRYANKSIHLVSAMMPKRRPEPAQEAGQQVEAAE